MQLVTFYELPSTLPVMRFLRLKHILIRHHSSSLSEPPPDRAPSQEAVREYGIYTDALEELATLALQFCEKAAHFAPKLLSNDTIQSKEKGVTHGPCRLGATAPASIEMESIYWNSGRRFRYQRRRPETQRCGWRSVSIWRREGD